MSHGSAISLTRLTTGSCWMMSKKVEFESPDRLDSWMNGQARAEAGEDKGKTWIDDPYEVKWATRYDLINSWN